MKLFLTSLDPEHGVNPMVGWLFKPLPELALTSPEDCDLVCLSFIAAPDIVKLDAAVLGRVVRRGAPVVVLDHMEALPPEFVLGVGDLPEGNPYYPLHRAMAKLRVRAYFKRELLTGFANPLACPMYPLDWVVPEYREHGEVASREQFNARPIDLLMSWGYSSESRPRLHGELMRQAGRFGAHLTLAEDDVGRGLAEGRQRMFALLFAPWYRRIGIKKLLAWQHQTKVSISLQGSGLKCFRCAEASYNSLLAQQSPERQQWSYPWVAGENCIGLPSGKDGEIDEALAVQVLWQHLREAQGSLHSLYLRCLENQKHYRMEAYARHYLLPKILKALR